jgi:hypothetical protein
MDKGAALMTSTVHGASEINKSLIHEVEGKPKSSPANVCPLKID